MAEYYALSTLKHILFLLFVACLLVNAQISDKRLCADKECKVVISKARALGRHTPDHPMLLSFNVGDEVTVTSKSAGSNPHLWGGEVNGHKGYFDKNFVQEHKILVENPMHEVDTGGDLFEKLGKPPSQGDRKPVIVTSTQNTDLPKESIDTKADNSATSSQGSHDNQKPGLGERSENTGKTDVGKLKVEEVVDDLLITDYKVDYSLNNDETDLSENGDQVEDKDDNHDDEKRENNDEEVGEYFWDELDDSDYYARERDRFDTADLNQFLKSRLFSGSTGETDDASSKSKHETDEGSLKVEPEVSIETKDQSSGGIEGVGIQEQSNGKQSEGDKVTAREEGPDVVPETAEKFSKDKEVDKGKDKEEKTVLSEKQSIESNARLDNDDFDPTDIDDNDVQEDIKSHLVKESNDTVENDTDTANKEHSENKKAVVGTSEHYQEGNGLSQKNLGAKFSSETQDSRALEKESEADSDKVKVAFREKVEETATHEADSKEKASNLVLGDDKTESKEEDNKDNGDKVRSVLDSNTDYNKQTSTKKEDTDNLEDMPEDVRPDTPSGTLLPDSSHGYDPVTQKIHLDREIDPTSFLEEDQTDEPEFKGSEETINPLDAESTADLLAKKHREIVSESKLKLKEIEKSEAEHIDRRDDDKPTGDGFVSFLQSSRSEPNESDFVSETPKLNTDSTLAFMEDSSSSSLELGTQSSRTSENRLGSKEKDKNIQKLKSLETILEGGSTIVLDGDGNLLTAFSSEGQVSQESNDLQSSIGDSVHSLSVNSQPVIPTPVESLPHSSEPPVEWNKKLNINDSKDENVNQTHNINVQPGNDNILIDTIISEAYQSSDFNSRKVLSVSQPPATSQRQQHQAPPTQEQPSEERKPQETVSVEPTPAQSLPFTPSTEASGDLPVNSKGVEEATYTEDTVPPKDISVDTVAEGLIKDALPDQDNHSVDSQSEGNTQPTPDNLEIPSPVSAESWQATETSKLSGDYDTDSVYHSRKITDEDLMQEEEQRESSPGFFRNLFTSLERLTRDLVEKLPPSVQAVLEPLGLLPNMKGVVVTFTLAILMSMTLVSCCFSGGSNKKQQRELLVKFDEIEKKRLIDLKEKEGLEDEIAQGVAQNKQLEEETSKFKEESKKNKSDLHKVQVLNEALEKQLEDLQGQVKELKENESFKLGEVKQQSRKTKEMEKKLKKLEEREKNLEQTAQKLMSDLKHKEEEVTLLTSKVAGLTDQVGHLQTSKDQLLAEAVDWKEKVSDLKERLMQRVEEFKQMQETIMFKESELEVLKDCFLQLKSFEENDDEGENTEDVNARVQEKIASMMDVSKMSASVRALEEEKDSLANKLEIELEARRELEEQLENSRRSVESSMADKMKAERQCQEAQTKLSVLSSYFKEKEMQLQRELGEQEALKKQNQNKLVSADETTKTVQQELEYIRTQSESLKRELASSERDFRSQIAANEKKAHENWLAARAAERELKEARHEAGVLRQKLTDIERRQFMGPGGLIRPLPTRGIPPAGVMNGPPPPGMERSPSRGSLPPLPPLHMRDDDFLARERGPLPPPFPLDPRRGPLPPPGMRPPFPDGRSPPPRGPPFSNARSPPLRMPPPGMLDGRSPPPYDRRPPPHHMMDRRSPPFRLPPPDMLSPPLRGGPLPPPHLGRGGSPPMGPDSPRQDGRYPLPPYARNPPPSSDRPFPKQNSQASPRQQQSQV